jgi:tRNA G37 N-methylase Trm5
MNTSALNSKYLGEVYSTSNGIFCVSPNDNYVTSTLLEESEYGKNELERIYQFSSSESLVLMLGAHIGTLAIPLSKKIKHLFAVEANPDTFKLFQLNLLWIVILITIKMLIATSRYKLKKYLGLLKKSVLQQKVVALQIHQGKLKEVISFHYLVLQELNLNQLLKLKLIGMIKLRKL